MPIGRLRLLIKRLPLFVFVGLLCWPLTSRADEEIFADDFEESLSSQWDVSGISKEDYRISEGGLELRVQPGKLTDETPMLTVTLPTRPTDVLVASVEVTVLDRFTEPSELAGLYLTAEGSLEFGAKKQHIDGHLLFSPGEPEFIGNPGEEGDPEKYAVRFWPATKEAGPLRVIIRNDYAYFQVGPNPQGSYLNLFHSAIEENRRKRSFALVTAGGPDQKPHWVRFDNFRVLRLE